MKYLKKEPKGSRWKKNRLVLLWVLACLVVLSVTTFTLGKYVLQMRDRATGVATDFFFRSDYLTREGNNTYDVFSGVIRFKLFNHDGVNETDRDIVYTITVKQGENTVTGYTLSGNTGLEGAKDSANAISISGLSAGTYTVSATSSEPYVDTISATFDVHELDGSTLYKIDDMDPDGEYIVLHVFTGSSGTVKINFSSDLAIDNTDSRMTEWVPDGENVWNGSPNAHYEFIFFENAPSNNYGKTETKLSGDTITITANS